MIDFHAAYLDYARHRAGMAPDSFHQLCGIATCCAALSNRTYIRARFGRIYPALWLGLIGPSTVRKSSAVNAAADLIARTSADLMVPQDFSREALVEHLARTPYGMLAWPELGVGLEAMARDYNAGVMATLTDIWDSRPQITRLTKGAGMVTIEYPALTILAAGKPRWFQEYIRARHIGSGFLGRWLFLWETEYAAYVPMYSENGWSRAREEQRQSLVAHLQGLMECDGELGPGPGSLALDAWLERLEGRWSDDDDPAEFSKRAGAQVTKLAIGIQAGRGPGGLLELEDASVREAIRLWERCFTSGRELIAGLRGSMDADALTDLRRLVRSRARVTKSELLRETRLTSRTLSQYMETLEEAGEVEAALVQTGKGRPATVYEWVG